jgi:SET domain-containing protein
MIVTSLYLQKTEKKGWGVFTSKKIKKGSVIEISPVIVMSAAEKKLLDQTTLYNYIFDWDKDCCCMAMGYIPLYNHASPSNCEYFQNYEEETIFIQAVRNIEVNEELTINYNGDWNNENDVWFSVHA